MHKYIKIECDNKNSGEDRKTIATSMTALSLIEDITNERIRRELVFRDHTDFPACDDDWLLRPFGTGCWNGVLEL